MILDEEKTTQEARRLLDTLRMSRTENGGLRTLSSSTVADLTNLLETIALPIYPTNGELVEFSMADGKLYLGRALQTGVLISSPFEETDRKVPWSRVQDFRVITEARKYLLDPDVWENETSYIELCVTEYNDRDESIAGTTSKIFRSEIE